ncbi:hypothetical protein M404DRAFT_998950 [Pisolithus tinctorius Marx 270]|uniref:Uncharacterized protein n=1 Tax=Pisolithus tinctorius Marx 270 TaxID=870435 RepID=A0A0C3PDV5_PISTI|nr:hypothetical protein M404DRAFT_998950 [Pisolithus tinctorius Marx 270]
MRSPAVLHDNPECRAGSKNVGRLEGCVPFNRDELHPTAEPSGGMPRFAKTDTRDNRGLFKIGLLK